VLAGWTARWSGLLAGPKGVGVAVLVGQEPAHECLSFRGAAITIHGEGEITQGTDTQRRGAVGVAEIARVDDVRVIDLDEVVARHQRNPQSGRQGETDMP